MAELTPNDTCPSTPSSQSETSQTVSKHTSIGEASSKVMKNGTSTANGKPPPPAAAPPLSPTALDAVPPTDAAALEIYNRYAALQQKLTTDFQRDLSNAIGIPLPSNSEAPHTNGTSSKSRRHQRRNNYDDSDDSGADDMPPPANPDKPSSARAMALSRNMLQRNPIRMMPVGGAMYGRMPPPPPPPSAPFPGEDSQELDENGEPIVRVRASKMEYKKLDELFNKHIYDFYLTETATEGNTKEDKWEEYVFVVIRKFDFQNKYLKTVVDVKSVEIRDVLREVYKDVKGISLREDKPTVGLSRSCLDGFVGNIEV